MNILLLGATGYAGLWLIHLLLGHDRVDAITLCSQSSAGESIDALYPSIARHRGKKITDNGRMLSSRDAKSRSYDLVFAALPHDESLRLYRHWIGKAPIIDLSADLRLPDRYDSDTPSVRIAYGLSELFRDDIAKADIIANPGCYPTAALLPLLPLARHRLLEGAIDIFAISGISGAGGTPRRNFQFCERAENANAYSPGRSHKHWFEISYYYAAARALPASADSAESAAANRADAAALEEARRSIRFAPHLAPLRQGIAATTICSLRRAVDEEEMRDIFDRFYRQFPFVTRSARDIPETRDVRGTNRCDYGWRLDGKTLYLFSAIDNMVKGAAGQAIQNMNIRFGFPETTGLPLSGSF